MQNSFDFLNGNASDIAPLLLGSVLERSLDGETIRVKIVETESYDQTDLASHSYNGQTPRTTVMFGPAGFLYVYFTYGMHYCCNIVVGPEGHGSAVLIRAVEPVNGVELLQKRRPAKSLTEVTNGPAKLCQALAITNELNGHNLRNPPLKLLLKNELPKSQIITSTRIGISRGKDLPWRFYIKNNQYVSKR